MKNIFKIILVILTIIIIVLIIKKYYDNKFENFSSLNTIDRVKIYHLKSREPKEGVINPFPASVGSKVLWAYICGETTNPNDYKIDFNYLKSQYPNYICLSFAKIVGSTLMWNNAGCGQYDKGFLTNLKKMHDIGVCISISIGGGTDSTFTKVTDIPTFVNSFEMMRSLLVGVDGIAFIDGIDFDIEDFGTSVYPEMGENFNDIARAMKQKGYVVTAVPAASQLTPGCGYSWAGNKNNLINLDFNLFDGVMIQWYQGGCLAGNSGICPSNGLGAINILSAFSGTAYSKKDPNNANNPPSIGACYGPGSQVTGKWATDCKDCTTIPSEKIVLGLQTYRLQQTLTFEDLVQVTQSGVKFAGVGFWQIGDSVYEQNGLYKNLAPKLANLWKIKPYF